ncbi:MAG TPA: hypothetical protein VEN29_21060 [Casimicrobiaceae bacterium]|nr:hypothetical protein [Casimicrobiaceae bacterium]
MRKAMPEERFKLPPQAISPPTAGAQHTIDPARIGLRLVALLEQLAAMRLDLVHGTIPRVERMGLDKGDLDYLLVQLDAAIAAGRGIAASLGPPPASAARQEAWRSE